MSFGNGVRAKACLALSIFALVATASTSSQAIAQTARDTAEIFGARASVQQIRMSPSGDRIVFIAPMGSHGEAAYTVDLANDPTPRAVLTNDDEATDLSWCEWATDERLVCRFTFSSEEEGLLLGFSRLVVVDRDGQNAGMLSQGQRNVSIFEQQFGGSIVSWAIDEHPESILITRNFVRENSAGTMIYNNREGLAVERVDINSLKRRQEEKPRATAERYIADGTGAVRIMSIRSERDSILTDSVTYSYRKKGESAWNVFKAIGDLIPIAVDQSGDFAYAFGERNGFDRIFKISLDGRENIEPIDLAVNADVDGLIRIGRERRVVGLTYATERRERVYFDPELDGLTKAIQQALPGKPSVSVFDESADKTKLLLIASSDIDPGMVYRFDKTKKALEVILPLRENVEGVTMGQMQPVNYSAADGTSIPGYLTLPPGSDRQGLPAIVMPHGGPSSRDEWGFSWLAQFFAQRGFAVLQPNFRGSEGYGQDWYLDNGFKSWRTAIGDVTDAGRWLVSEGIADPEKLAIVGWSYGGYAALQSNVLAPDLFKATVAIAPVTDFELLRANAWRFTNSRLVKDYIGEGPHLTEGSPLQNVAAIQSPVLMYHGDIDQNVDVGHARKMRAALESSGKNVTYVEFESTDHYIDDSDKRTRMLTEIDAFLAEHLNR